MLIHFIDNIIVEIFENSNLSLMKAFPNEFAIVEDAEIGDRYKDGFVIKPQIMVAHEKEDGFLEFLKIFEFNEEPNYYKIIDEELFNNYLNSGKQYKMVEGVIVEYLPSITKEEKHRQLEKYINNLKEIGVEYNGLMFKCDDLASSRMNKIITGTSVGADPFPLTWITRNSEQGVVSFNNREEFIEFYKIFSDQELKIQVKEATYKMMIDLAQTQEDLDNIIFE